jgi:hypothetical protein
MSNDIEIKPQALTFNRAQKNFLFNMVLAKDSTLIWSRGTGKSTIIAWIMHLINVHMPRSCWNLQGVTFQQILTRTLPGTLGALELLGYRRDFDYFIGRFPPAGFYLPYQAPGKAENFLFLINHKLKTCVGFSFLSQDRSSSRGPNRDGCICDESLLLDVDKFNTDTRPTIRGNRNFFGENHMHHAIYHFSSMPHGESFLFEGNDYYEKDGNKSLLLRDQLADMQLEFIKETDKKAQLELWSEILEVEKGVKFYSKRRFYYSEYNAFDNVRALGLKYIMDQLKGNTELLFQIEILNKRIGKIGDAFYAHFNRNHHGYKGNYNYSHLDNLDYDFEKLTSVDSRHDNDCLPDAPLDIGMDFGTAVNRLGVGQELKSQ